VRVATSIPCSTRTDRHGSSDRDGARARRRQREAARGDADAQGHDLRDPRLAAGRLHPEAENRTTRVLPNPNNSRATDVLSCGLLLPRRRSGIDKGHGGPMSWAPTPRLRVECWARAELDSPNMMREREWTRLYMHTRSLITRASGKVRRLLADQL